VTFTFDLLTSKYYQLIFVANCTLNLVKFRQVDCKILC